MRNALLVLSAAGLAGALAVGSASRPSRGQAPGGPVAEAARLPGARPVVRAIDYPSLQAAIDALPAEGGGVELPPGTFEIRAPLTISSEDVLIRGSGTSTHIRNLNTDGEPAISVRPAKFAEDPRAMQWRVALADLRVTGNPASGHGVEAVNVNEMMLTNLTVSRNGRDGIRMVNCYEDPRIVNCLITYNKGTGLALHGCHDIVVSANQFEENRDAVHCLDGFNLCMTGNCLDDHLGDGVVIENTYGSVVSGNMIEECRGTAIVLDRDCYGITLSANVIAHETEGGIDLRDAHGCAVTGNTFPIVKKNALVIGPQSGRITVTGNAFADSFIGDGGVKRAANDREASGLTLRGAADVAVSGNLFSGLRPRAIVEEGPASPGTKIAGNVTVEARDEPAPR